MKYSHIFKKFNIVAILVIATFIVIPFIKVQADDTTDATTTVSVDTTDTTGTTTVDATASTTDDSGTTTPVVSTGSIIIHKLVCPEGTSITDGMGPDVNGNFTAPAVCAPESGIIYGYIYETKHDTTDPYPGLDVDVPLAAHDATPFTIIGTTDVNGEVSVNNVNTAGRYDIAEVNADGSWANNDTTHVIRLFCSGDMVNYDNYETALFPDNGNIYCVGYNTGSVSTTTGTTTDTGGNNNGGGTATSTDNGGGNDNNGGPITSTSGGGSSSEVGGGSGYGGSGPFVGQVLGASTGPSSTSTTASACDLYLTHYIKPGVLNDFESVIKLQLFLNNHEGAHLIYTGIYDSATIAAVNAFQVKYNTEVLVPWYNLGLLPTPTTFTGYVYKTTEREINNLVCPALNLPIPPLP